MILEERGHRIVGTATNGAEAVAAFERLSPKPEIIIMDYQMPGKNGLEAMKEILHRDSKAKVIFATADRTVRRLVFEAGAVGFIHKPFNIKHLITYIERIAPQIIRNTIIE